LRRTIARSRRAVGSDDDNRWLCRLDRTKLGNCHLIFRQHFEQIRFEGLVGAVQLVDQEHRRGTVARLERLHDRPPDEEPLGEDIARQRFTVNPALRFREPDLDHLPRIVPFVDRRGGVETFVALQAHERAAEPTREDLGDLRLAHARFAFEKERPSHLQGEKNACGEPAIGEIVVLLQQREHGVDAGGYLGGSGHGG